MEIVLVLGQGTLKTAMRTVARTKMHTKRGLRTVRGTRMEMARMVISREQGMEEAPRETVAATTAGDEGILSIILPSK
jgi:Sec-independent protein translocase protein TatA